MNKAVILDRDGTLVHDPGYVHKLEDFKLLPGTVEALKLLEDFKLFMISNQSGIGRSYYTENDFHTFNNYLLSVLNKEGINILETKFCPHHPDENCDCRKPSPKNVNELVKKHNIDIKKSFVIGDHPYDIELGQRAGTKSILVLTGHGKKHFKDLKAKPDFIAKNILEAAEWIIKNEQ